MSTTQRIVRAEALFFTCAAIIVVSIVALFAFLGIQGLSTFQYNSPITFFFGTTWNKTTQQFGVVPLLYGSIMTVLIALVLSAPIAIGSAIYMTETAHETARETLRVTVQMFAALPSVPDSLREGSMALGATRWQTIWKVLLLAARSGLLTALILGVGRAIGETMAVQMVIGNITESVPANLVTGATTMPATIVTQLPEAALPAHHTALIMVAFVLLIISFALIVLVRQVSGGQVRSRRVRVRPAT